MPELVAHVNGTSGGPIVAHSDSTHLQVPLTQCMAGPERLQSVSLQVWTGKCSQTATVPVFLQIDLPLRVAQHTAELPLPQHVSSGPQQMPPHTLLPLRQQTLSPVGFFKHVLLEQQALKFQSQQIWPEGQVFLLHGVVVVPQANVRLGNIAVAAALATVPATRRNVARRERGWAMRRETRSNTVSIRIPSEPVPGE
jgi:hypothetical protein